MELIGWFKSPYVVKSQLLLLFVFSF